LCLVARRSRPLRGRDGIPRALAREAQISKSTLFKLIASGATRGEALARMAEALGACVVEGVRTTIPFLRQVLANPEFVAGRVHTQMIEQGAFNG